MSRNPTRTVQIGTVQIGAGQPIAVQSMCATKTADIDASVAQTEQLREAGASIVRLAVDSQAEADALREIRLQTSANLVVDLQENYRLAEVVAPYVDKFRYNPGHLHHHEKEKSIRDKVAYFVQVAREHDCAIRVGVNCGSVDPRLKAMHPEDDVAAQVESALEHVNMLEELSFDRFCVSLKDSDPAKVIRANLLFAERAPQVPLHLGVTEAGLPPDGVIKTRIAFEQLLSKGIGDTVRVSLTLPNDRKHEEVEAGHQILRDIEEGRFRSVPDFGKDHLNVISCPSCSRVENEVFVELAQQVKEMTRHLEDEGITIAVMGCRVNGPGETDDADLGLWCGPAAVNLKRKDQLLGAYSYGEILDRLKEALDKLLAERVGA